MELQRAYSPSGTVFVPFLPVHFLPPSITSASFSTALHSQSLLLHSQLSFFPPLYSCALFHPVLPLCSLFKLSLWCAFAAFSWTPAALWLYPHEESVGNGFFHALVFFLGCSEKWFGFNLWCTNLITLWNFSLELVLQVFILLKWTKNNITLKNMRNQLKPLM